MHKSICLIRLTAAVVAATALTSFLLPLQARATVNLGQAVAVYNMQTLDDSNGANSALTIVNTTGGTYGTGVFGNGFWANEGPGSDDFYANGRSTARNGAWFDAGQGAGNELQITGAHTMIWRGEIKNASITGYLWSKYDHTVGPNSQKNRTAYTRYEPGGSMLYVIDDGDGGLASVNLSLPAGTLTTGGNKYEIATVFDPDNDSAALYVLDPKTRAVLASTSAVLDSGFNTIPMNTPVPFTLGDRLAWSGSSWNSIGGSGAQVDIEMFAVWDQAHSLSDIQNMIVPEPTTIALLGLGLLALTRRRR